MARVSTFWPSPKVASWNLKVATGKLPILREILAHDPRPHYQDDPTRIYAMEFANVEVRFRVDDQTLIVSEVRSGT